MSSFGSAAPGDPSVLSKTLVDHVKVHEIQLRYRGFVQMKCSESRWPCFR